MRTNGKFFTTMLPKGKLFFVLCLILLVFGLQPAFALDWKQMGWISVSEKKEQGRIYLQFKDGLQIDISVIGQKDISDFAKEKIFDLYKKLVSWPHLKIREMRFVESDGVIELALLLGKLDYKNKELLPFLPSGMVFTYSDTWHYNFRLKVKNLFVTIRGSVINEKELFDKIVEASDDPHGYLRKRDPEFFLRQLEKLEKGLRDLTLEKNQLEKKVEMYRDGMMTLHNQGVFSSAKAIDKEKVLWVLEQKKKNPAMSREAVEKALEEFNKNRQTKLEISSRELNIIFWVYFNE